MKILAIDTSCDETSAAIVEGRSTLSHIEYSQVVQHVKWGGVVPSIARRAHEERLPWVINRVISKARCHEKDIDCVAVTYGPGLAIALEVGIRYAIKFSQDHDIPLVRVNHMEGHLYSPFVQNSKGNPRRDFQFPYLGLLVSGGHTEIVLFKDHLTYEVLGETRDDAAGEALDKGARMLGFGYPGGPVIESLAKSVSNKDTYRFPRPMQRTNSMEFSFSGLKTSLLYTLQEMKEDEKNTKIHDLASSFQEAVFDSLIIKTKRAIEQTKINRLILGGGVAVNSRFRAKLRSLLSTYEGSLATPPYKYLNFDNAAMIGLVGHIRAERNLIVKDLMELDRVPRLSLLQSSI